MKGNWPGHTYTEADWNPVTLEAALSHPGLGYAASKTYAEKASWDFLEKEKPNFTISTMNPPMVLGPVVSDLITRWHTSDMLKIYWTLLLTETWKHHLTSLTSLNTSNQRVRDILQGKVKEEIPNPSVYLWVDVRDLALCHVKAFETEAAANKRFCVTAGYYCNKDIAQILRKELPDNKNLPSDSTPGGGYPQDGYYGYDNSGVKDVLGIEFGSLDQAIKYTVRSIQSLVE
jgi:nucleoside-diphosphate-sugar epimerase